MLEFVRKTAAEVYQLSLCLSTIAAFGTHLFPLPKSLAKASILLLPPKKQWTHTILA